MEVRVGRGGQSRSIIVLKFGAGSTSGAKWHSLHTSTAFPSPQKAREIPTEPFTTDREKQ